VQGLASWAFETVAAVLAPPRCAACDAPLRTTRAVFCGACAAQVQPVAGLDSKAIAAFVYGGAVARAIVRLKYESRPDLARPLGDLLWRAIAQHGRIAATVVVPVPLHPDRLAERGFNQSALLAARVARGLGAQTAPRALRRLFPTAPQRSLDRRARASNVGGAFALRDAASIRDASVLLVDDVCTTGATLEACVGALFSGGAARIATAVVARTESWSER